MKIIIKTNTHALIPLLFILGACAVQQQEPVAGASQAQQQSQSTDLAARLENVHPEMVLDSIAGRNLYQLKVMGQKHNECSMHQERNLLFGMSMLRSTPDQVPSEYKRLNDSNLFEEMACRTVCLLENPNVNNWQLKYQKRKPIFGEPHIRREPKIKKFIKEHANFSDYLPSESDKYIQEIVDYQRYIQNDSFIAIYALAKELGPSIESDHAFSEHMAFDLADLIENGNGWLQANDEKVRLYQLSAQMHLSDDFLIPINLSLNSVGSIWHATSLIIHKKAGVREYIFMDPLNWKLSSHENYQKVIDSLMRLSADPKYFKESIIRSGYFMAMHHVKVMGRDNYRDLYVLPLFSYLAAIEDLSLSNDEFFTKYYRTPTCQLINKELEGPAIAVELNPLSYKQMQKPGREKIKYPNARAELLKRFKCDI